MKNLIVATAGLTFAILVSGVTHAQPSGTGNSTPPCPPYESLESEIQKRTAAATAAFEARNCAQALPHAEWVAQFKPINADALYILIKCYEETARYERAISTCERVNRLKEESEGWSGEALKRLSYAIKACDDVRKYAPRVIIETTPKEEKLPKGARIVVSVNSVVVSKNERDEGIIVDSNADYNFSASVEGLPAEKIWLGQVIHKKFSVPGGGMRSATSRVVERVTLQLNPPPKPVAPPSRISPQTIAVGAFALVGLGIWAAVGSRAYQVDKESGPAAARGLYQIATAGAGATIVTLPLFISFAIVDGVAYSKAKNVAGGSPAKAHMTLGPGFMSFGGTF